MEKYCYIKNHFIPSSQDQMLSEEVKVGEKTKIPTHEKAEYHINATVLGN